MTNVHHRDSSVNNVLGSLPGLLELSKSIVSGEYQTHHRLVQGLTELNATWKESSSGKRVWLMPSEEWEEMEKDKTLYNPMAGVWLEAVIRGLEQQSE